MYQDIFLVLKNVKKLENLAILEQIVEDSRTSETGEGIFVALVP